MKQNGQNTKSRKGLIILIVILLLCCAAAAGWIIRTGLTDRSPEVSDEENAEAQKEEGPTDEEILQSYYDRKAEAKLNAAEHIFSHRGIQGELEHSFITYDEAIAAGSKYIEQDLVISRDGTLFVSHDRTAYAMTGVDRYYSDMTDEEIRELRTYRDQPILSLEDVFERYGSTVDYVIELKTDGTDEREAFVRTVRDSGLEDRVIVQSFFRDQLDQLESDFPDMAKLLLCRTQNDIGLGIDDDRIDIVSAPESLMNEDNCRAVHEAGKLINVWTLNTEDAIREAIRLGVDTYFTNDTPLALSLEEHLRYDDGIGTVFFASDYQAEPGMQTPADSLAQILDAADKDDRDPDTVVMCGDYTNDRQLHDYQLSPEDSISEIRYLAGAEYPYLDDEDMLFVQGNHDALTESISASGLHEFDDYLIYVLNTENDFPWKQGKVPGSEDKVRAAAESLRTCLDELKAEGETRPVFIAGHVPLHFTARTSSKHTTGDNLYSSLIFDVVNDAAGSLDIIYLFGHDHSKGWDCYLGGSSVFREAGDTILIPQYEPGTLTTDNYTEEILDFTYMNAGYTGYYMNCGTEEYDSGELEQYKAADDTLTGTVFEVMPDRIMIRRYAADGPHPLGWDGEADPYKGGIDTGLIEESAYSVRTPDEVQIMRKAVKNAEDPAVGSDASADAEN